MFKSRNLFCVSFFIFICVGSAMASGDVDIDLRCDSPSKTITKAIGNEDYDGTARTYTWSENGTFYENGYYVTRLSESGYVTVSYSDVKPYVLREDTFRANPNYYRTGMSGSGSDGWWIFEDHDSADYPPLQYHKYAEPTSSKNSSVTGTYYGQIKLTFKRFDGTTGEKIINVQIQKRECEAYNSGKWREVSSGRWEQQ